MEPIRHQSGIVQRVGARILLADDDAEMRNILADALRGDGYEVVDVPDAGEAYKRLARGFFAGKRHGGFDLLVYDVHGPADGALHVLEAMRHARWETPVMVITEIGADDLRRRIERDGGVPFEKPFAIEELREAIADELRGVLPRTDEEDREDPILEIVATRDSGFDAWTIKWLLEANGIEAFLGIRPASSPTQTDVYVLAADVARARALLDSADEFATTG